MGGQSWHLARQRSALQSACAPSRFRRQARLRSRRTGTRARPERSDLPAPACSPDRRRTDRTPARTRPGTEARVWIGGAYKGRSEGPKYELSVATPHKLAVGAASGGSADVVRRDLGIDDDGRRALRFYPGRVGLRTGRPLVVAFLATDLGERIRRDPSMHRRVSRDSERVVG